jgi:hypothetical protein
MISPQLKSEHMSFVRKIGKASTLRSASLLKISEWDPAGVQADVLGRFARRNPSFPGRQKSRSIARFMSAGRWVSALIVTHEAARLVWARAFEERPWDL